MFLICPRGLRKVLLSLPTKSLTICESICQAASHLLRAIPERRSCHKSVLLSSHYYKYHLTFDKLLPFFQGNFTGIIFLSTKLFKEGKSGINIPIFDGKKMKQQRNEVIFQNLFRSELVLGPRSCITQPLFTKCYMRTRNSNIHLFC